MDYSPDAERPTKRTKTSDDGMSGEGRLGLSSKRFARHIEPSEVLSSLPADVSSKVKVPLLELYESLEKEEPTIDKILVCNAGIESKKRALEDYLVYTCDSTPLSEQISARNNLIAWIDRHQSRVRSSALSGTWVSTKDTSRVDVHKTSEDDDGVFEEDEISLTRVNPFLMSLFLGSAKPAEEDGTLKTIESLKTTEANKKAMMQYHKKSTSIGHESSKYKAKLELALSLPFNKFSVSPGTFESIFSWDSRRTESEEMTFKFIKRFREMLDEDLYGLDLVKDELVTAIAARLSSNGKSRASIALCGPPGVGKTTIASTLAKAIGIATGKNKGVPFEHISLGGMDDVSMLRGSESHWADSGPGRIVKTLNKLGVCDGVILFDELDKISQTTRGVDVQNALLHITDFTQNTHFKDYYIPELDIDLSKIWFIFSMNDDNLLEPALKDRLDIIYIPPYSETEVKHIIKKHVLKKSLAGVGLVGPSNVITITDEACDRLIKKFGKGIRDIERYIQKLIGRLNVIRMIQGTSNEVKTIWQDVPCGTIQRTSTEGKTIRQSVSEGTTPPTLGRYSLPPGMKFELPFVITAEVVDCLLENPSRNDLSLPSFYS